MQGLCCSTSEVSDRRLWIIKQQDKHDVIKHAGLNRRCVLRSRVIAPRIWQRETLKKPSNSTCRSLDPATCSFFDLCSYLHGGRAPEVFQPVESVHAPSSSNGLQLQRALVGHRRRSVKKAEVQGVWEENGPEVGAGERQTLKPSAKTLMR